MVKTRESALTEIGPAPTNGAEPDIDLQRPYVATVEIEGVAPLLFHAWNNEAVEEKAKSAKGSKAKKSDNVESYVYRLDNGEIGIPGEYIRGAIINAAKFRQDPRSPRKSMMDLMRAAIVPLTELASLGKADWDYIDMRRVTVQRNAITRHRPAFLAGWTAEFELLCNLSSYVPPELLADVLTDAGRLIGIGDFRPSYGRFQVRKFAVQQG